jgi:predicted nucleic acid-binding protein
MHTLVDTNVLLRLLRPEHPQYTIATMALAFSRPECHSEPAYPVGIEPVAT